MLSSKTLSEANARTWVCQLVGAVAHLHACGIAHLDVKLENIFLDQWGRLKLGDLGLCALAPHGLRLSKVCGSGVYAAPEVLAAKEQGPYDPHAADVWSIGVCSFVMVRGRFPFSAQHPRMLLDAHQTAVNIAVSNGSAPPEAPCVLSSRSQRNAFSPKLMEMIDGCICLDPQRRPSPCDLATFPWMSFPQHAAIADAQRAVDMSNEVKASQPAADRAAQDESAHASKNGSDVVPSTDISVRQDLGESIGVGMPDDLATSGGVNGYNTPNNGSPTIVPRLIAATSPSPSKLRSDSPSSTCSPFPHERRMRNDYNEKRPAPYRRSPRAKASPLLASAGTASSARINHLS